jgi:NAD(P)-dependent dehydrogenase (short-subunit alcohol dehydrogenase family)
MEGHRTLAIPCDVSNDTQVQAMIEQTVAEFGRLDAAFNNAGVMAKNAPTAGSTLEEFDRVTRVNLRGVWSCMKHELRQMERQGGGAIVNCSSIGGLRGDRGIGSYTASKQGVIGLTRAAAVEYAAKGIRVNAVCPGTIDTTFAGAAFKDEKRIRGIVKARGDRVGGALAVQPGSELRGWALPCRRRWADGGHPVGPE